MRAFFAVICFFIVIVVNIDALAQSKKKDSLESKNTPPLQLILKLDKKEYFVGDRIICQLTLENISSNNVTINNGFLINARTAPHQIYFQIIKNNVDILEFLSQVNAAFDDSTYKILNPKSTESYKYMLLSEDYDLKPGSYTVQAFYENLFTPSNAVFSKTLWQGTVASSKVTFKIR